MSRRLTLYLAATAACMPLGSLTGLAGQATGDLWQVTPQMSMAGMAIPLPPQTVCSAKQGSTPPAGSGPDRTCMNSNFAISGNTANWTITCQSPPSTGVGQITRMGDSYSGFIEFNSAQGEMTINLTGSRVGDCDNPS